jgi:hypothetical protein
MKKLLFFALPLLAAGSPAMAEVHSGFRLEAMAGYDILKGKLADAATAPKRTVSGAFFGVSAGFDAAVSSAFSVGGDAEFTFSTADAIVQGGELTINKDLYAGGRVTAGITDSVNLYGKVGYTRLRLRYSNPTNAAAPAVAGDLDGVRGAVGVQFTGDDRTYYGFEGRYSDYEQGIRRTQAMLVVGTHF